MWMARRHPERDHLGDYWNALNRGAPPEELARLAAPLDPTLLTAIDRARALHRRRRPDPAFASQLEQTLMNALVAGPAGTVPLGPTRSGQLNGRTAPPKRSSWIPPLRETGRRTRWLGAQLVTAMLIVVALAGIYLLVDRSDQPAVMPPVQIATPDEAPTGDWTNFKGDAAHRGVADAGPTGDAVELWRFQAGGPCLAPPAAVAGVVYAACGDGNLYAIDAATGDERWRFTAKPFGDPTVAGDLVYVTDNEGTLYAVDLASGEERWRFASPVRNSPVVDDGLLVMGTDAGELVGIDAATGAERWRFQITDEGVTSNPAISNGIVYAGSDVGIFVAVDAATGEQRWRTESGEGTLGTAVVAEGIAYIGGSADGGAANSLSAFDAQSGDLLWRRDEPIFSPSVSNGVGYSGSNDGVVYAFDTATGVERWRTQVGGTARPPAVAGDVLYVASDGDRTVYAFDTASGDELWRFEVDGGIDGSIAVSRGVLYVNTHLGSIYAIGGTGEMRLPAPNIAATPTSSPVAPVSTGGDATPAVATDPVEFLWETAGGSQPFSHPINLTVAPDGRLWVADGLHSVFQIFEPDGTFVEEWGTPGSGDGQFNFVRANGDAFGKVAFAPDGTFYVADTGNQRVQHFDQDRTFLKAWGGFGAGDGQFLDPFDLAVDADGNVFVNDDYRTDIQKFDADGSFIVAFGGPGDGPVELDPQGWLDIDPDGNVWVADPENGRVVGWTNDGEHLATWGEDGSLGMPMSLAFDGTGRMIVVDFTGYRVLVLDSAGQVLAEWGAAGSGEGEFREVIADIAVDGDGRVFVSSFDGPPGIPGVVQAFRLLPPLGPASGDMATPGTEGTPIAASGPVELLWTAEGGDGGIDTPGRMALDPQGRLWVVDNGNGRLQIIDADGAFIETWGAPGDGDGEFQFRRANGDGYGDIEFGPDGGFFVLDPGNVRVQAFDAEREFVTSWGGFGDDPGQFRDPVGIAVAGDGTVWVVDDVRNDIQHFSADGELLGAFPVYPDGGNLNTINGLAVDDAGNLYVSDIPGYQVMMFAPDGTLVRTFGGPGEGDGHFTDQPGQMAIDADGRLFVTENGVHVFGADGQFIDHWAVEQVFPWGIVLDDDGNVYVSAYEDNTVMKFRLLPPLGPETATPVA